MQLSDLTILGRTTAATANTTTVGEADVVDVTMITVVVVVVVVAAVPETTTDTGTTTETTATAIVTGTTGEEGTMTGGTERSCCVSEKLCRFVATASFILFCLCLLPLFYAYNMSGYEIALRLCM
jgi:hypothetical protein